MADDVVLNPGAGGDSVGADDIGGIKYQRVKIIHGEDGTNDGDVSNDNPLPVINFFGSLTLQEKAFFVQAVKATATALDFTFSIPAGAIRTLFTFSFSTSTDAVVTLLEGPTWTTSTGSAQTLFNFDRNSVGSSQVEEDTTGTFGANDAVGLDQTGITGGTTLLTARAAAAKDSIEGFELTAGIILKASTLYALRLTGSSGTQVVNMVFADKV